MTRVICNHQNFAVGVELEQIKAWVLLHSSLLSLFQNQEKTTEEFFCSWRWKRGNGFCLCHLLHSGRKILKCFIQKSLILEFLISAEKFHILPWSSALCSTKIIIFLSNNLNAFSWKLVIFNPLCSLKNIRVLNLPILMHWKFVMCRSRPWNFFVVFWKWKIPTLQFKSQLAVWEISSVP